MPTDLCTTCWSRLGGAAAAEADGVGRFFLVGATMELGGSGRSMMMSAGAGAGRATGSSTTIAKIPRHRHREGLSH